MYVCMYVYMLLHKTVEDMSTFYNLLDSAHLAHCMASKRCSLAASSTSSSKTFVRLAVVAVVLHAL